MKPFVYSLGCLLFAVSLTVNAGPIGLHPKNPRYFIYKGKPLLIVTSAEHYGAVLNPAFDYMKYLNTLKQDGMNYTRIFTGSMYWELKGDFHIPNNTLAPSPGTALVPWKRSGVDGNANGGNKFDLDQWNDTYFERLKSFIKEAKKRDIIVEVTLFTSIYSQHTWSNCPIHPQNNINQTDITDYKKVHTLDNGKLLQYQERFVVKMLQELNKFDNIIYEIQNEPWCDQSLVTQDGKSRVETASQASLDWQRHISGIIVETEKKLKNKHLIAQNYCNNQCHIADVDPQISVINFHYATPFAVSQNDRWNKVIGFDESGFAGSDDHTYRRQAWAFIMSGGGLFNNLDYSFAVGYEDGTLVQKAPGGGSPALRKQLYILRTFLEQFDFIRFSPDGTLVESSSGATAYALSDKKKEFAVYLEGKDCKLIRLRLPAGKYRIAWINTLEGSKLQNEIEIKDPVTELTVPDHPSDIALSLVKIK